MSRPVPTNIAFDIFDGEEAVRGVRYYTDPALSPSSVLEFMKDSETFEFDAADLPWLLACLNEIQIILEDAKEGTT